MHSIDILYFDGVTARPFKAKLIYIDSQNIKVEYFNKEQVHHKFYSYKILKDICQINADTAVVDLKNNVRFELSLPLPY